MLLQSTDFDGHVQVLPLITVNVIIPKCCELLTLQSNTAIAVLSTPVTAPTF